MLRIAQKEFLLHSKEKRAGKQLSKQAGKQAGKHLEGIQSEPCPVGACSLGFHLDFWSLNYLG